MWKGRYLIVSVVISWTLTLVTSDPGTPEPKLSIGYGGLSSWKYIGNGTGLLATNKSDLWELEISCKAPYPIQWTITGRIFPPEFVKIQAPKRSWVNSTSFVFEIRMILFFNPDDDCYSSSSISCQNIIAPAINSSIQVFVPGGRNLLRPSSDSEHILTDELVIPCPTTDPTIPVKLSSVFANGTELVVEDADYDPVVGFKLKAPIHGKLICSSGNDTLIFRSIVTKMETEGDDCFPKIKNVKGFASDTIELKCSSSEESVELVTEMKLNYLLKKDREIWAEVMGQTAQNGTVTCKGANGRIIWTWDIELLDGPELYLDNFESEVNCLSEDPTKSVSTVRCRNPSDCEFMKHCLRNASACNFKRQKQFSSNYQTRCWVQERNSGASCASLPYNSLNALVQCSLSGLAKEWTIFTALDFRKYSNWQNVAEANLVRLDPVPSILSGDQESEFFCEAVAFLFADSLKFAIQFQNGTVTFLDEYGHDYQSSPSKERARRIDELNVVAHLKMKMPKEAVGIQCHAPWANSTHFQTTVKHFIVRDGEGGNGTCTCASDFTSNVL